MSYTQPVAVDWDLLERLRGHGVLRVTFHPDGAIASVDFKEPAPGEDQHEPPAAPSVVKRRQVSRLVPRVPQDPDNH